jgi:hypothetical protein
MANRGGFLETRLKERLLDTRKHLQALEKAVASFPSEFDLVVFEQAWVGDADERLTAYPVQAGYENVINGCVKIAQELCELEGWTSANLEPSSTEALKKLKENGIIGAQTQLALMDAYARRGDVQHDYVGAAARGVHAATKAVIEHVPLLLQDVALHLRQRGSSVR